ncbi:lipopolysaccharide biosynthesis protein [Mycolicibacterium psychrotolerans]
MPLIILPFISQVMPPAEYGKASMLTASSLLLTTVLAQPLDSLVFRSAARDDDSSPALLRLTGLYCYVVMPSVGLMAAGLVALLVPSFLGVSGHIWSVELAAVGFLPATTCFALPVVQATQDLRRFAWLALTSITFMAGSKIALVLIWPLGVTGWVISDLISAMASAAIALLLVPPVRAAITSRHIRSALRFALPLVPHKASFWAIASLSRPVMAAVSTLTQVGLLSLGWNIASVANLILSEINRASMPQYSREEFPAPSKATLTTVRLQLVLAVTVPALVGSSLALLGQWVFPSSYWPAFAVVAILLLGQASYGLYLVPANFQVQTAGTTRPVALASSAGAALMLILLLLVGRSQGAIGAAYSIAIGFTAMLLIALGLGRLLKLNVRWQSWCRCWPEMVSGAAALAVGVAAALSPVGSAGGKLLGGLGLALVATAFLLCLRPIER